MQEPLTCPSPGVIDCTKLRGLNLTNLETNASQPVKRRRRKAMDPPQRRRQVAEVNPHEPACIDVLAEPLARHVLFPAQPDENHQSICEGDFIQQRSSKDAARIQQGSSKETSSKNPRFGAILTPIYGG